MNLNLNTPLRAWGVLPWMGLLFIITIVVGGAPADIPQDEIKPDVDRRGLDEQGTTAREYRAGLPWQAYDDLAAIIGSSSALPADRQLTENEWKRMVRVAVALQNADPEVVERTLIVYMIVQRRMNAFGTTLAVRSKPMLLLRIMFDIPEDEPWEFPLGASRINPCGGLPYRLVDDGAQAEISLSLPIKWDEEGPSLTALLRTDVPSRKSIYQPHDEYRYFLAHYPYRRGLEQWLGEEVQDWGSLISLIPRQ